jgi:hypothetical protein
MAACRTIYYHPCGCAILLPPQENGMIVVSTISNSQIVTSNGLTYHPCYVRSTRVSAIKASHYWS